MKIVIDARMYGANRWTGIGRYIQQLITNLEQLDQNNKYVILLNKENFDEYNPSQPNFSKRLAPYNPYTFGEQLRLPWLLYRLKADVVHFPSFNAPLLYFKSRVTTIHDLTLIDYPSSRYTGFKRFLQGYKHLPFRLVVWWMATRSTALITPTQHVKEELVKRYKLDAPKITVTLESVDTTAIRAVQPPHAPNHPFIFYVGTYYPHKNIPRLIEAFALVVKNQPHLQLVLAGKSDYFYDDIRQQVARLSLTQNVHLLGFVSDAELAWLYEKAEAYVFPSLSEGFGLPGLEAMAHATPVIAAEASCLPEVYGSAAAYFDPLDIESIATTIGKVLGDTSMLENLSHAGRAHVSHFSWEAMARLTLAVYRNLR